MNNFIRKLKERLFLYLINKLGYNVVLYDSIFFGVSSGFTIVDNEKSITNCGNTPYMDFSVIFKNTNGDTFIESPVLKIVPSIEQ